MVPRSPPNPPSGAVGLRQFHRSGRLVGAAFTVRTRPGDNLAIHRALELVGPDDVIVVDGVASALETASDTTVPGEALHLAEAAAKALSADLVAIVIDEAHQLEDIVTQYFGVAVSTHRIEELARDATRPLAGLATSWSSGRRAAARGCTAGSMASCR